MQSVRTRPRLLGLLCQHDRNAVVAVSFSSKKNFRRSAHAQATRPPKDSLAEQLERYVSDSDTTGIFLTVQHQCIIIDVVIIMRTVIL